ncbi:hypothetical protein N5J77_28590 [Sphingobium yanoikuyae]|uniref:DUF5681 domain-containing protein n=1 Tax=Sphingobium yanoikuyae TaxID=13690 RepID=A0AA43BEZ2_SPHYA|nr:hypothetical protein [Sphingobium yanoikuyae]MDH2135089.1 hypothetical protein [Sphingobium yanoikuyae]MDH2169618.1 hypothetical protein [Sphingobium yanoikuyae]
METKIPPPWGNDWQLAPPPEPKPPREKAKPPGNPAWVKGMKSPNPAGRKPGSTAQTILLKRMLENADGIVDMLISKAMEGDTNSASLILSRIMPSIKAQAQKVAFDFDHTAPASQQVEQVIAAIADGTVPADIGRQIIDAISSLSAIRVGEQLEARIEALEAASNGRA